MDENESKVFQDETEEEELIESGVYVHDFRKPLLYNGVEFLHLTFDFSSLTGRDMRKISEEMKKTGKFTILKQIEDEFLLRCAVRACREKIGEDAFDIMSAVDYNKILARTQSFFSQSA